MYSPAVSVSDVTSFAVDTCDSLTGDGRIDIWHLSSASSCLYIINIHHTSHITWLMITLSCHQQWQPPPLPPFVQQENFSRSVILVSDGLDALPVTSVKALKETQSKTQNENLNHAKITTRPFFVHHRIPKGTMLLCSCCLQFTWQLNIINIW